MLTAIALLGIAALVFRHTLGRLFALVLPLYGAAMAGRVAYALGFGITGAALAALTVFLLVPVFLGLLLSGDRRVPGPLMLIATYAFPAGLAGYCAGAALDRLVGLGGVAATLSCLLAAGLAGRAACRADAPAG